MHFGLFNLSNRRSDAQPLRQMVANVATLSRIADQIPAIDVSWVTEHHFSNYSMCPSPLMYVAHLAPQTTRIRLGTAVVVAPLYNPLRLAGEVGWVDNVTGGRLVLGVGSGYQPVEFERFGLDIGQSVEQTLEVLDILDAAATQDSFAWSGKHYQFPETRIVQRPLQRPHPEIWIAGSAPALMQRAARKGYVPMIGFPFNGLDYYATVREKIAGAYRDAGMSAAAMRFGILAYCHVTDSKADALAYAENAVFQARLANQLRGGRHEYQGDLLVPKPYAGEPDPQWLTGESFIGDPHTVAERLARVIRAANPYHIALFFSIGDFDHGKSVRSLERFGAEVVPLLEKAVGPLGSLGVEPVPAAAE